MSDLTPQEIVAQLDRYIVGQPAAKRALATALRERERRKRLPTELREEIPSKNIMVIGPTGVGKTELARRMARLIDAPFLKTEATKFTEVGYVGRDVESIIRELADASVSMVHQERAAEVREEAEQRAAERILNSLMDTGNTEEEAPAGARERSYIKRRRRAMARRLADRELEERVIEIEVEGEEIYGSVLEFASGIGPDEMHEQFQEFMNSANMSRQRSRRVPVREARRILIEQEANKLIDFEEVIDRALRRVEQDGIVFLDEVDKLVGHGSDYGPDVSGEGVQRDLLPMVEGATVTTRYGVINTEHILFIAAGAFTRARPADLLPELQGRFPIRVEVHELTEEEFVRILTEPDNALTRQYAALLETEGVHVQFTDDGIGEIARCARILNSRTENLGARRLYGVMEKVLEDVSFRATDYSGSTVSIDAAFVRDRLSTVPFTDEVSKYIL